MTAVELREGEIPGLVDGLTELHATYYGRLWDLGPGSNPISREGSQRSSIATTRRETGSERS